MTKGLRETFVGIFVVVGVIVFIALYTWLSGKMFFSNTYDVRVYFGDVEGLRAGDPVLVYGIEKGKVKSLRIDSNQVEVILAMDRDVHLPDDTKISIRAVSYIGADKYVKVTPGTSDKTSDVYYGTGSSLDLEALGSQLDSLITTFGKIEIPDLDEALRNLSTDLSRSLDRLLSIFKEPVDKIDVLATRLDSLSMLLKGDGTVGRLLKSDELYEELRETNLALKALIEDINENPKKYINIKVF
ncbi:MAG: MCE family protein [candidate division WOR-3 bacterium]|nr:MAG: MCE family protein [candidate division WOR-3 bacterium]